MELADILPNVYFTTNMKRNYLLIKMLNTSWLKRLEEDYSVRDVLIQTSGVWFEICSTIAKFLIKWKITQKRKRIRKKTKIINYVKNSYWSLNHCVELKKTVRLQNPVVQYKYGAKSKKKKKKDSVLILRWSIVGSPYKHSGRSMVIKIEQSPKITIDWQNSMEAGVFC